MIVSHLELIFTTLVLRHSGILVHASQVSIYVQDLYFTCSNLNQLCDRLLVKLVLLRHINVGYTNIFFCGWLRSNNFCCTFASFTIVILTWYDITPYSIVLPKSISAWVFNLGVFFWVYYLYHYSNRT